MQFAQVSGAVEQLCHFKIKDMHIYERFVDLHHHPRTKFAQLEICSQYFSKGTIQNRLRGGSASIGLESGKNEMLKRVKSFEMVCALNNAHIRGETCKTNLISTR